jgi:hypothetical protein
MKYYVTLFDSNYLTRGLVMYNSLVKYGGYFHLWIICFDDLAYEILNILNLLNVTLVRLSEFELQDKELLKIKTRRTRKEYCWTCTPCTLLYVLNTATYVDTITYIDADLMFFSNPEPIFSEMGNKSILLIEHRYIPEHDQSATSGIYNVQFMTFRRNNEGLNALKWWRDRCIEWCYDRAENGKFGDQKYLDDWTERFTGVHVLQHLGAGLAPWNAAKYTLTKKGEEIFVEQSPLIFYHFHALKIHPLKIGYLSSYPLNHKLCEWIYHPYYRELDQSYRKIRYFQPGFNLGIVDFPRFPKRPDNLYRFFRQIVKDINQGKYYRYA